MHRKAQWTRVEVSWTLRNEAPALLSPSSDHATTRLGTAAMELNGVELPLLDRENDGGSRPKTLLRFLGSAPNTSYVLYGRLKETPSHLQRVRRSPRPSFPPLKELNLQLPFWVVSHMAMNRSIQ